jgi:DNA-binding NarL/FixJ family response regulator
MSSLGRIKVLIADDHKLIQDGLAALVGAEKDIVVVGEAADGLEAVEMTKALNPNVVVMDISMPRLDGIEAAHRILQSKCGAKVLMVTQYDYDEYIKRVVQAGASGYVLKHSSGQELVQAIRAVYAGDQFFTPSVSKRIVEAFVEQATGRTSRPGISLTHREREILQLIAEGHTNQEIGRKLHISVRTVEFHRANLSEKVGARDTAGLVKYAIQKRIITLEP